METLEENKKGRMFNPALQYGVITAVGLILLGLIQYLANLLAVSWIPYIGYVILLAGIILGTIRFRDEQCGGFINYGRALGFGTLTAFFAALISGIFFFVFYKYIAPDALERLKDLAEITMLEADPTVSDQQIELVRQFVNPLLMLFSSLLSYTFFGFIFSLITSAFLKKKDPMEV